LADFGTLFVQVGQVLLAQFLVDLKLFLTLSFSPVCT